MIKLKHRQQKEHDNAVDQLRKAKDDRNNFKR